MGLSFGDKRSSEEITLSLHFEESDGPSSSRQEWRDNDSKGSELEDIQVMEINGGTIVQSNQTT
jgi:hypothetical protein